MRNDLADLYGVVAKVKKHDVRFRNKRYRDACCKLVDWLSGELFPNGQVSLAFTDNAVSNGSEKLQDIDTALFFCDCFATFEAGMESYKNRLFRRFVSAFFAPCEETDAPLVNINPDFTGLFDLTKTKTTARSEKIRDLVEQSDRPLLISGNSSSGKTVSVAQAVNQLRARSYSCTWIDLANVNVEIEHFVYSVFRTLTSDRHIIVVDNVQSYPSKVSWIRDAIQRIIELCPTLKVKAVNICWRSARKTVEKMYAPTPLNRVECDGDDVIIELVRYYTLDKYEREILSNSAGDVLIARSMIDFLLQYKRFPSEKQLSQKIYDECTKGRELSSDAKYILYILASLGEFEIHARQEYLERISPRGFAELSGQQIFRTYKTEDTIVYITIGHRSLAHKVALHLQGELAPVKPPVEFAIEYLTIEGEKQILSTLERLDLELEIGDSLFANLWQAFCNMRASLIKQLSVDPTWGNNMASMIFAAEALTNIKFDQDSVGLWKMTAAKIRERWRPDEQRGIAFIGGNSGIEATTEIVDFTDNIRHTMREDEQRYPYPDAMLSSNIDYGRFHDNWLLGLLLGFEGLALDDSDLKTLYIAAAEKMQQTNGAFYPERVCWVTARVIMGLCQCGLTYTDPVVKKACNWLVAQLLDGKTIGWSIDALNCYGWRSGTGTWNSNEQITLMCLCALFAAGYPVRKDERVSEIIREIWRCRKSLERSFIEKGTILDIMWIIDVMLYDDRNPIDLKEEIKYLTDYIMDKWNNASLLSSEKETESSDVSFMSKELIFIVWALLKKNLEQLLKGLALDYSAFSDKKKIFISYRREEGGGSAFAQELYRALAHSYKNEVFLDVYDLKEESRDFSEVIEKALDNAQVVIAVVTDHSFERAYSADYDNSSDVFYSELHRAIEQQKDIITIYNSSIKRPELPDALKVNPDFYEVALALSRKNATFYDSTVPDAMDKLTGDVVRKIKYLNI